MLAARTLPAAAAGSRTVGHGAAATVDTPAAAPARYIIALDDVLSSGEGGTSVAEDRWPAFLAQRVRTEFPVPSDLMVVEPGGGIGRHALDLSRAIARLAPGIVARNGVKFVIVLDDIEAASIHALINRQAQRAFEQGAVGCPCDIQALVEVATTARKNHERDRDQQRRDYRQN